MLKRFEIPKEVAVRVPVEDLRWTAEQLLQRRGMNDADAKQTTDVLMYADVRGIDTHGVSNMLRHYMSWIDEGRLNPRAQWRVTRESKATCVIDGDRGHGMVVSPAAMETAIERAREFGIGSVSVMNCRHLGPCSYYAQMAVDHDMLGLATTTGGMAMVPTHGTKPLLGLNALAFAAPAAHHPPFVYDAAPSVVAGNKITIAKRLGQTVPGGWLTDENGRPIMEESEIPAKFMMLPLGSTREGGSQKGYSLAVMCEILTSLLCAAGAGPRRREGSVHHFLAYDIAAFCDPDDFKADLDQYLTDLLDCPTVSGEGRVLYSGYPEAQTAADRTANGIPLHPEVVDWFRQATGEAGIAWRLTAS